MGMEYNVPSLRIWVKLNGVHFSGNMNGSQLQAYNGDPTTWLYEGSIVLALSAAERRHETINYTAWVGELHDWRIVQC